MDLKKLKIEAEKELNSAQNLNELNQIFRRYLGKQGELTNVLRSLSRLSEAERIQIGKEANELKNFLKIILNEKAQEFKKRAGKEAEAKTWIDISAPGEKGEFGHLHPLTLVRREIEEIFKSMGFVVAEGPEVETEWYNFDALNIPKDHPARDAWDTFWLRQNKTKDKLLLRTHTSPAQIRYMQKNNPPLRIIVPGRVFRYEATDASHEFDFWQVEGLMVDKNITVANFKGIMEEFLKEFFKTDIETRLRPGFFPFVEPGFELDMSCFACKGRGCGVCKKTGWIEMMGAGMVHPNVLKAAGLNSKNWQGFAFGVGMDRLAMMKYKINDIRLFNSGDLRFLNQF